MTELQLQPWWVRNLLYQARRRAKRRGLPFTLTPDDMEALVQRAGGRCELTSIAFEQRREQRGHARPFAASLDRRDAALGYTFDNCRLVTVATNSALGDWGDAVFEKVAEGLLETKYNAQNSGIGLSLASRKRRNRRTH